MALSGFTSDKKGLIRPMGHMWHFNGAKIIWHLKVGSVLWPEMQGAGHESAVVVVGLGGVLWFFDIKLSHACTQGTSVETENFGSAVFAADLPMGLLQHTDDIIALDRFQRFLIFT